MTDPLETLFAVIKSRIGADPSTSYTAQLLAAGTPRIAKKLGEEAVELALAAALGERDSAVKESADLLYHWLVLMAALGIEPQAVFEELARRQNLSGLAEKATR